MYKFKKPNTQLVIHAKDLDEGTMEQITNISLHPAFKNLISIMPDAHLGSGCVIGFTGKFKDGLVIPAIVGVDIGCGMTAYNLNKHSTHINFPALDEHIKRVIPMGFKSNNHCNKELLFKDTLFSDPQREEIEINLANAEELFSIFGVKKSNPIVNQLGTLGGGNHFIELGCEPNGNTWIIIHSGSRNFGLKVANFFQKRAQKTFEDMNIDFPKETQYLTPLTGTRDYLYFLNIAQNYAHWNRLFMLHRILQFFGNAEINYRPSNVIESVHNYINPKDNIVRKGAISAYPGEKVIIPLTMADGVVIGTGKGNPAYNFSAPHGAGRMFGRNEMNKRLESGAVTMEQFRDSMKGIYSSTVVKETIDESCYAYKKFEDIRPFIEETVTINTVLKPIYNVKAVSAGANVEDLPEVKQKGKDRAVITYPDGTATEIAI